eukprot:368434-Prymnesium_polylepis.1
MGAGGWVWVRVCGRCTGAQHFCLCRMSCVSACRRVGVSACPLISGDGAPTVGAARAAPP